MDDSFEEKEEVRLSGHLEMSGELCSDGTEALALETEDGEEYIINSRKVVRRLLRYVYEHRSITCTGYVTHDPTGIEVLTLTYFEVDAPQPKAFPDKPYDALEEQSLRKQRQEPQQSAGSNDVQMDEKSLEAAMQQDNALVRL